MAIPCPLSDKRGVAATELALLAPMLLLMLLAMVDITRFAISVLVVDRVAAGVADLGAQFDRIRAGTTITQGNEVGVLFLAAQEMGRPLDMTGTGKVIVSSVSDQGAGARLMWQACSGPAGCATGPKSGIASVPGAAAALPEGFSVRFGDTALFVEAFYDFRPYLLSARWLGRDDTLVGLRRSAVRRPRLGALTSLDP